MVLRVLWLCNCALSVAVFASIGVANKCTDDLLVLGAASNESIWFLHPDKNLIYSTVEPNLPGVWAERRLTLVALQLTLNRNEKRFNDIIHDPACEGREEVQRKLGAIGIFEGGKSFYAELYILMMEVVEQEGQKAELAWLLPIFPRERRHRMFANQMKFTIHLFEQLQFLEIFRNNYEEASKQSHGPYLASAIALGNKSNPLPSFVWSELFRLEMIPKRIFEDSIENNDALLTDFIAHIGLCRAGGESLCEWPDPKTLYEKADNLQLNIKVPTEMRAFIGRHLAFLRAQKLGPSPMLKSVVELMEKLYVEPF